MRRTPRWSPSGTREPARRDASSRRPGRVPTSTRDASSLERRTRPELGASSARLARRPASPAQSRRRLRRPLEVAIVTTVRELEASAERIEIPRPSTLRDPCREVEPEALAGEPARVDAIGGLCRERLGRSHHGPFGARFARARASMRARAASCRRSFLDGIGGGFSYCAHPGLCGNVEPGRPSSSAETPHTLQRTVTLELMPRAPSFVSAAGPRRRPRRARPSRRSRPAERGSRACSRSSCERRCARRGSRRQRRRRCSPSTA